MIDPEFYNFRDTNHTASEDETDRPHQSVIDESDVNVATYNQYLHFSLNLLTSYIELREAEKRATSPIRKEHLGGIIVQFQDRILNFSPIISKLCQFQSFLIKNGGNDEDWIEFLGQIKELSHNISFKLPEQIVEQECDFATFISILLPLSQQFEITVPSELYQQIWDHELKKIYIEFPFINEFLDSRE